MFIIIYELINSYFIKFMYEIYLFNHYNYNKNYYYHQQFIISKLIQIQFHYIKILFSYLHFHLQLYKIILINSNQLIIDNYLS